MHPPAIRDPGAGQADRETQGKSRQKEAGGYETTIRADTSRAAPMVALFDRVRGKGAPEIIKALAKANQRFQAEFRQITSKIQAKYFKAE